jgi:hypothetical protein
MLFTFWPRIRSVQEYVNYTRLFQDELVIGAYMYVIPVIRLVVIVNVNNVLFWEFLKFPPHTKPVSFFWHRVNFEMVPSFLNLPGCRWGVSLQNIHLGQSNLGWNRYRLSFVKNTTCTMLFEQGLEIRSDRYTHFFYRYFIAEKKLNKFFPDPVCVWASGDCACYYLPAFWKSGEILFCRSPSVRPSVWKWHLLLDRSTDQVETFSCARYSSTNVHKPLEFRSNSVIFHQGAICVCWCQMERSK